MTLIAASEDSHPPATKVQGIRRIWENDPRERWLGVVAALAAPVLAITLTTYAGFGASPELALSVTRLVQDEHIAHAEALKEVREQELFARGEILWFARAIYSESEYTDEQRYVAWAIRNRKAVHWYPDTYEEVVLQPYQFSGLNEYDHWYELNMSRDYDNGDHVWRSALQVAVDVYYADDSENILPADTTHFYSPVAVTNTPKWARGKTPVKTLPGRLGTRFAFFNDVN